MASQILVPLDGSSLAEQALPCAMYLARGLSAKLILLRVFSIPPDFDVSLGSDEALMKMMIERAQAEANNYLSQAASKLEEANFTVQPIVRQGPVAETIIDYAAQANVQHIVMATHGYTGIRRWTHGSVAERVLQSASVPVLLVRAREDKLSPPDESKLCRHILVPLDGSAIAEQVLPPAVEVAQALGAEIILFQVSIVLLSGVLMGDWHMPLQGDFDTATQNVQDYLDKVATKLRTQGINVSTAIRQGPVADSIIDYAEANQIDLIAICTHGRTGLARWALGSVADRVLRAGNIPVLLVRAKK
ncbi:MAG: universal stress protein [Anaerolineae bacterium]|nr:universal stress protein [Anaerolineae bacterium]